MRIHVLLVSARSLLAMQRGVRRRTPPDGLWKLNVRCASSARRDGTVLNSDEGANEGAPACLVSLGIFSQCLWTLRNGPQNGPRRLIRGLDLLAQILIISTLAQVSS